MMIGRFIFLCVLASGITAGPLYRPYVPAVPGSRPACARGTATFCESVDKYPKELIQKLLQAKFPKMYDLFTDESEGLDEPPEYLLHQEMPAMSPYALKKRKSRSLRDIFSGKQSSFAPLQSIEKCPVRSAVVSPEIALNEEGEWRYIVHDDPLGFRQKVDVELCSLNEKHKCNDICIQRFNPVPMLSIAANGIVKEDTFLMPSSCQCLSETSRTT